MKIHIFKSKTLQIKDFEPVRFEYGLEQDLPKGTDTQGTKEVMERIIDGWIEEETTKLLRDKQTKANHGAVHPSLDKPPF
jgi:hypothetical protein